jgi:hypothetical protein
MHLRIVKSEGKSSSTNVSDAITINKVELLSFALESHKGRYQVPSDFPTSRVRLYQSFLCIRDLLQYFSPSVTY